MIAIKPPLIPKDLLPFEGDSLTDSSIEGKIISKRVWENLDAKFLSIEGSVLSGVEISSAKLHTSSLGDCRIVDCFWLGCDFDSSGFLRVEFEGCNLSGINFAGCNLKNVLFRNCKLALANFREAELSKVSFQECDLSQADFQGGKIKNAAFSKCELTGADFRRAALVDVDFRKSDLKMKNLSSLKGAIITSTQAVGISIALASEVGIVLDDD